MSKLIIVKHNELTDNLLKIICEIKSLAWNYNLRDQKKWIVENIQPLDMHVLLEENGHHVAYLNLVKIKLLNENGIFFDSVGVGNVCAKFKSRGYGSKLIQEVNKYIKEEKKIAVLFCKEKTTHFYLRNNYKIENEDEKNIFFMSFNNNYSRIEYNGEPF